MRVHREHLAAVPGGAQLAEHRAADGLPAAARTDHDHGVRLEHGAQPGGGGHPVPGLGRRGVPLVGVEGDLDPQRRALAGRADRQAQVPEDAQHQPVLGEDVGDQPADPPLQAQGGEVLEQDGGQPEVPVGRVDDRRHLPGVPAAGDELHRADQPPPGSGTDRDGTARTGEGPLDVVLEIARVQRAEAEVAVPFGQPLVQVEQVGGVLRSEPDQEHR